MRFVSTSLDLSKMPAPDVVKKLDYEAILAERIEGVSTRLNEAGIPFDTGNLDSDPVAIIEQEDAYRELIDLQAINDAARARMLAFATGRDLEHIASYYGISRLLLDAGDSKAFPPRLPIYETDSSLRARVQLAPEAMAHGGTAGAYRHLALQAAPELRDVGLIKRRGGYVDVILLARDGDGTVSSDIVERVARVFAADDGAPLTDIVSVRSVGLLPYTVSVTLRVPHGPDISMVRARALESLAATVSELRVIGEPVPTDAIIAAARVANIKKVVLDAPMMDVQPDADQIAYCESIVVNMVVVND